jgi:predicted Zn finger-like uncharacterized protein
MSLKTRCPACDTIFKIVPDQLKISNGWVRCGRCAEVFDAAAHAASTDDANPWPQTHATETVSEITKKPSLPSENDKIATNIIAIKVTNKTATEILIPKNDLAQNTSSAADLSFIRIAKNKAFWQRAAVTRTLIAACVGLTWLLVMQVVYDHRHQLAAKHTGFKSGLDTVCQTVGCTIEPHKNIEGFKIDSSSFQKITTVVGENTRAEAFTLKLSLKNNANTALAVPAVELTLTEAGDKPVLRRVLLAKELGFNGTSLAANGDWSGTSTLNVTPNPAMATISGYRVLLFYP